MAATQAALLASAARPAQGLHLSSGATQATGRGAGLGTAWAGPWEPGAAAAEPAASHPRLSGAAERHAGAVWRLAKPARLPDMAAYSASTWRCARAFQHLRDHVGAPYRVSVGSATTLPRFRAATSLGTLSGWAGTTRALRSGCGIGPGSSGSSSMSKTTCRTVIGWDGRLCGRLIAAGT